MIWADQLARDNRPHSLACLPPRLERRRTGKRSLSCTFLPASQITNRETSFRPAAQALSFVLPGLYLLSMLASLDGAFRKTAVRMDYC